MPRWVWFAPLAVLLCMLALWGFRLGWVAATITETDIIERYTARYVETHGDGAQATDCTARPGPTPQIWIVVTCVTKSGESVTYAADSLGRGVTYRVSPGPVGAPET